MKYYINRSNVFAIKGVKNVCNINNEWLLYNPDINYWVVTDEYGKEVFDVVARFSDETDIRTFFYEHYQMDDKDFENNITPILSYYLKKGFVTNEPKGEPIWMKMNNKLSDINKYYFDTIYISLNDSCNLNCIYCFNKSNRKYRNNSSSCTLSVDNIVSVLKEYKEIGGKTVVYTGGEPTLNKDFFNIVSEVNKIGLKQEVITNGTLLNSLNVAELVKYISRINISIDSNRQEELKQLWNVSNFDYYYSELINGLNRLDEVLAMYPQIDFSICVLPVITSINILSVEQLMLEISKYTHFKTSWKFTKYSLIQDEKIDKLLDISMEDYLEFLKKIGKNILRLNEEKSIEFAVTHCGERSIREKPTLGLCNPGFFITYHGDVYPCQGLEKEEYFLGSIFNNTLKELFYSDCFCEVRKHLFPQYIEKCHSCELRYVCTERCSLCNIECKEIDCKDAVIRRMYYKLKSNGVSL